MMMDSYHNGNLSIGVKRKDYCNRLSELDSRKPFRNKMKKFPEQEIDKDYKWLLDLIKLDNDKKTKGKRFKNVAEHVNGYVNENVSDDGNDEDPQYRLFLENLVPDGKTYKLKVSKDDEPLRFLYYEQPESSDVFDGDDDDDDDDDDDEHPTYEERANLSPVQDMQIVQRDGQMLNGKEGKVATVNEVSKNEKMNGDKSMNWDPCYLEFFKSCNPLKYGSFLYQGKEVIYEEKKEKQIVLAENCDEHLSLKENLMTILRKPFSKREYIDLKNYVEEQKPICRHMDLRDRSVSSALEGMTKSLLDRSTGCFRRRYESAKQELSKAKALNLLRMLRFWLEHVPNEDSFEPWFDKEILEVLPLPRTT